MPVKPRITPLVPILVALALAAGCSFDAAPLTARQCTTNGNCSDGFMCFEGYCIVDPNAGDTDLPDMAPDVEDEPELCRDGDGDGRVGGRFCPEPENTDCNDSNDAIHDDAEELCNAIDDNCDGLVDNLVLGLCPLQDGVCALVEWSCPEGIRIGDPAVQPVCDYGPQYVPAEEYCTSSIPDLQGFCADDAVNYVLAEGGHVLCDEFDNDCDGEVNEGNVITCYGGERSELQATATTCEAGTATCDDGFADCVGEVLPAPTEDTADFRCDGLNNDCNTPDGGEAAVDPDCTCGDGDTRPCYTGPANTEDVGTCVGSTQGCVAGVWDTNCPGEVVPTAETCGNMLADNDCDTVVDNIGGQIYGDPCFTGLDGLCNNGTKQCDVETGAGTFGCQQTTFPIDETCNNKLVDNDCDGNPNEIQVSEGGAVAVIGSNCTATGVQGECRNGTLRCPTSGGDYPVCEPATPGTDFPCNGLDEDCTGSDAQSTGSLEDCSGCGDACTTGASPICCSTGVDTYACQETSPCN